jgi:DNA-binding LytR/AlgR family response regulator
MFKIAVCDDEQIFLNSVKDVCVSYLGIENVEVTLFSKGKSLLECKKQFDLIFLDIEMPDLDGIQVMHQLELYNHNACIVFLTNYDQYVREAYGKNVIDFLDKPLKRETLERILAKVQRVWRGPLIEFKSKNGILVELCSRDICYIEARNKYTVVKCCEQSYTVRRTMKEWESILPEMEFGRASRFFFINYQYYGSMNNVIALEPDKIITVGRKYEKEFHEKLKHYMRVTAGWM